MVGLDGRFWLPMEFRAPVKKHASSACAERTLYGEIATKRTKFTLHLIAGPGPGLKNKFIKKLFKKIANWQVRVKLLEIKLFNPNWSIKFPLKIRALENILRLACCKNQC